MDTKMATAQLQVKTARPIIVPQQELKQVKEAYKTATAMNGVLAEFIDVVMDKTELTNAKNNYLIALGGVGLPQEKGYYLVDRQDLKEPFKSITEDR
jgi:hypothetical protein